MLVIRTDEQEVEVNTAADAAYLYRLKGILMQSSYRVAVGILIRRMSVSNSLSLRVYKFSLGVKA